MLEKDIQNNIISFLKEIGFDPVFAVQNGATFDPTRKIFRKPGKHREAGISDIIGLLPNGKGFAIEVKSRKGRPTEEQLKFITRWNSSLGVAFISRSVWQTYSQLLSFWPQIQHFEDIALAYKQKEEVSSALAEQGKGIVKGRIKRSKELQN